MINSICHKFPGYKNTTRIGDIPVSADIKTLDFNNDIWNNEW